MRARPLVLAVMAMVALGLAIFAAIRISSFVAIFSDHSGPSLTQAAIERAYNKSLANGTAPRQPIPKIIHQIFHNWHDPTNESLPEDWEATRQTCIANNPGFQYHVRRPPSRPSLLRGQCQGCGRGPIAC